MTPTMLDAVVLGIRIPGGGILGVLIVAVVSGIVMAIIQAAKKPAQPGMTYMNPGPAPFCNTCGTMGHWVPQFRLWGCARCQNYIGMQPNQPPAPPVAQAAQIPNCATCGGMGRWLPESHAFGCDRCRQLIKTA